MARQTLVGVHGRPLAGAGHGGQDHRGLLFAPAVLRVLEQGMALGRLLAVIGGFSVLLVALTFLQSYLSELNLFGKMNVRVDILDLSARKRAGTSRTCWTSASWT